MKRASMKSREKAGWSPISIAAVLISSAASAQVSRTFDTVVEEYVAEGLRSNLALQTETLEVEKASAALTEARARFFPELSFEARYTRAEGGREIEIPLGSSLNPVYSTLNQMLQE